MLEMQRPAVVVGTTGRPVTKPLDCAFNATTPAPSQLRDYQIDVINSFNTEISTGKRRPLIVLPTGAGKTVLAAAIIKAWTDSGRRVLFLAHRRELIRQCSTKLHDAGVDHGILLPGYTPRPGEPVQVASIATIHARAIRGSSIILPPADIVILDEAHHCRARTYQKIIAAYPHAVILGLTATPCRGDGRGLGPTFDVLVSGPSIAELIALNYLVPTRVYAPNRPDLNGVRVERGDYAESQLAEVMNTSGLVGDIVEHWHKLAQRRPTVVFATGVAHSVNLRDQFRNSGVMAEHIDGSTPTEERDAILRRLAEGKVELVTNAMVLTEGWDSPSVSCLVLARPTKSMGLFRQMVGRVLRPAPGKADALILDHSGAVFIHGFVEDEVVWTLSEDQRAQNKAQAARADGRAPRLTDCPECKAVRREGQPCPVCGWRPTTRPRAVDVADGELGRVDRDRRVAQQQYSAADMRRFHGMLAWIARDKKYSDGWTSHKYRERFGSWPATKTVPAIPPDDACRSWVKSRMIAYAKAMEKRRGAA